MDIDYNVNIDVDSVLEQVGLPSLSTLKTEDLTELNKELDNIIKDERIKAEKLEDRIETQTIRQETEQRIAKYQAAQKAINLELADRAKSLTDSKTEMGNKNKGQDSKDAFNQDATEMVNIGAFSMPMIAASAVTVVAGKIVLEESAQKAVYAMKKRGAELEKAAKSGDPAAIKAYKKFQKKYKKATKKALKEIEKNHKNGLISEEECHESKEAIGSDTWLSRDVAYKDIRNPDGSINMDAVKNLSLEQQETLLENVKKMQKQYKHTKDAMMHKEAIQQANQLREFLEPEIAKKKAQAQTVPEQAHENFQNSYVNAVDNALKEVERNYKNGLISENEKANSTTILKQSYLEGNSGITASSHEVTNVKNNILADMRAMTPVIKSGPVMA